MQQISNAQPLPTTSLALPSIKHEALLSESLARALASVIAEKQKEFDQAIALRDAEFKAFKIEMHATFTNTIAALTDNVLKTVEAKLATLKDGRNGEQGQQGEPGKDGERGLQGPQGERGEPGPEGPVGPQGERGERGAQGEAGAQGQKGDPGKDGLIGERGEKGTKGDPGRDGMPGRDGLNGLQGERGTSGKDGINGIDGKDGAGFDDFEMHYDGERTFKFQCGSGDRKKERTFVLPVPIDRGRFELGKQYQRGDGVLYGGNFYRAIKDTSEMPSDNGGDWRLIVNKGRNGRDGKDGAPGPQGPEGRPGRDLTQLGPDGRKW